MKYLPFVAAGSLLLSSCMFDTVVRVSYAPARSGHVFPAAAQPREIDVFRTQKPETPFEEIGTLYADSTDLPKAIDLMRAEAARQGGDALIDIKVTSDGIVGTVIRYK